MIDWRNYLAAAARAALEHDPGATYEQFMLAARKSIMQVALDRTRTQADAAKRLGVNRKMFGGRRCKGARVRLG